jgi:hypothetical protein
MRAPRLTLLPLVSVLLLTGAAHAATVYKWVDAQGVIHFSDQPHPQAQELEVKEAPAYNSPPPAPASSSATSNKPAPRLYSLCELYRPENDEVFLNTSTLTAKLRLQPQLSNGDRIFLALDGKRVTDQPTNSSEFVLNDVDRGTHTLFAVVLDMAGNTLCTTPSVTFHVRQPSVQAPVRSVRPRF